MRASHRWQSPGPPWAGLSIAVLVAVIVLAPNVGASTAPGSSPREPTDASLHPAYLRPLDVVVSAAPSTLNLGEKTNLSVRVTGYEFGVTWTRYNWTVLPVGCDGANSSALVCTPSETGTFNVTVFVNDSLGQSGVGARLVTVTSSGGSSLFSAATLIVLSAVIGIVAAAVTAIVIVSFWRRRRRGAPMTPMPERPYVPPDQGPP